jgi:hypothetical protein
LNGAAHDVDVLTIQWLLVSEEKPLQ